MNSELGKGAGRRPGPHSPPALKVRKHKQFFHYSWPIPQNPTGLPSTYMMALAFCLNLGGQAPPVSSLGVEER